MDFSPPYPKRSVWPEPLIKNQINNLDYCINMITTDVQNTINPSEIKYHHKIKDLEHKI